MTDDPNVINVKSLGAKGDGRSDDSSSFVQAIAAAEKLARNNPAPKADGNKLGTVTVYIPAGSYVIKQSEALIRSSYRTRTVGLRIIGAGLGATQILFQPTVPGGYLMKNNDAWLYLSIADLTIDSNHPRNNFMDSYSAGGAQKYTFNNVQFSGAWNYCFELRGSNNNSEFSFYSCTWIGSCNKALYVSATGSDQFVNYNFYACDFEVSNGDFIHLERGGNVNVWGGSFIHYEAGGTFFRLLGSNHAYGTERFLCIGARMEHRSATSRLIECEWAGGTVSFINMDASSSMHLQPTSIVTAIFKSANTEMPVIQFENCRIMGKHQYGYMVNSWSKRLNIKYHNCTFEQYTDPSAFVLFIALDNNFNQGGQPVVSFEHCRGASGAERDVWDCDYGFATSTLGLTSKKIISVKTPEGKFPYVSLPSVDVWVPMHTVITGIRIFWPANVASSQSKNWSFSVRTSESSTTTLAAISGGGVQTLAAGFSIEVPLFFVCSTAEKRHLVFSCNSSVNQAIDGCYCLIEYLG